MKSQINELLCSLIPHAQLSCDIQPNTLEISTGDMSVQITAFHPEKTCHVKFSKVTSERPHLGPHLFIMVPVHQMQETISLFWQVFQEKNALQFNIPHYHERMEKILCILEGKQIAEFQFANDSLASHVTGKYNNTKESFSIKLSNVTMDDIISGINFSYEDQIGNIHFAIPWVDIHKYPLAVEMKDNLLKKSCVSDEQELFQHLYEWDVNATINKFYLDKNLHQKDTTLKRAKL